MSRLIAACLLWCAGSAYSQDTAAPRSPAWGLTFNTHLSPAVIVDTDNPVSTASFTSGSVLGFEAGISRIFSLNDNVEITAEVHFGILPLRRTYFAESSFLPENSFGAPFEHLTVRNVDFSAKYTGGGIAAHYVFPAKGKTAFYAGGGVGLTYFIPVTSRGEFLLLDNNNNFSIFSETRHRINAERKVVLSPSIHIGLKRKIAKSLEIRTEINGRFSAYSPINEAEYTLTGRQQIISGSYRKYFRYVGLRVGVFKFFK